MTKFKVESVITSLILKVVQLKWNAFRLRHVLKRCLTFKCLCSTLFSIVCSCFTEKEFLKRKFEKYCNRENVVKLEGFSLLMEELGMTEGYKDLFR